MSVKEVFESMNWGDEYVKWEDFREYWKDDRHWKMDGLSQDDLVKDVITMVRNFQQLLDAALSNEPSTWQERLVLERDQLKERIWRLEKFLHAPVPDAPIPDKAHVSLLNAQLISMLGYLGILEVRLYEQALEDLPKEVSGEPV
jgi:hypothetical protein